MAFITPAEMNTVLFQYQLDQITENDQGIVLQAIAAAETEAKGYLSARYDVAIDFAKTGIDRDALLMEDVKNIALYNICRLCNVDMLYQSVQDRYDRTMRRLREMRDGTFINSTLTPLLTPEGTPVDKMIITSNPKFKHYY